MEQTNIRFETGQLVLFSMSSKTYEWPCLFVSNLHDDYVMVEDLFGDCPQT